MVSYKYSVSIIGLSFYLLLVSVVVGMPRETGSPYRNLLGLEKRQDDDPYDGPAPDIENDDPEPFADTDNLRNAVSYRSIYLRDNGALTSMSVGASPTDATMAVFTTLSSGEPIPTPKDTNQGKQFEIDHLLEMQNLHGAFSVLNKPSNIPQTDWDAVTTAVFLVPPKASYPPMLAIASIISGPPNMEAIPAAINNFKGQVFKGVINGGKGAPSDATYPTEFGPTVKKLLADRKPSYDEVIGTLSSALQAAGNNNADISSFFASYAYSVYTSATDFIGGWTGKTGVYTYLATSSTPTSSTAPIAATTPTTSSAPTSAPSCPISNDDHWPTCDQCPGGYNQDSCISTEATAACVCNDPCDSTNCVD